MKEKHRILPDNVDSRRTGRRIAALMAAGGLSVRDVQNYLGLSCPQGVYRWLKGDTLPSVDNLYALQRLLGTSAGHILRGSYRLSAPEDAAATAFYQRTAFAYGMSLKFFCLPACSKGGF